MVYDLSGIFGSVGGSLGMFVGFSLHDLLVAAFARGSNVWNSMSGVKNESTCFGRR
jgi:hypothetical protein